MSTASINNLSSDYLQSILTTTLQKAGVKQAGNSLSGVGTASAAGQPDKSQLSPFAQLMSTLQQLQQSDPAKYQQVTQQIATNLQSAAQTAQANGNTTAANQLNQLATDFSKASQSGQLPNIQDLAQAAGAHGAHRHHRHFHAAAADADDNSSAGSTSNSASSGSASQSLSQALSAFQANNTQSASLNPMSIVLNTLSDAGIDSSNR
ncbi:MAG: hypothetical protein LAP87_18110 [Acidobacteriia bacterium]|nr:hypothetical protein [Terriglobia bacterium]